MRPVLSEFPVFCEETEGSVIGAFPFFCEEAPRKLVFSAMVGNAFTAFTPFVAGFVCAGAGSFISFDDAFHGDSFLCR